MASLLDGEESYEAAQKHKSISADDLISMLIIAGKHLKKNGEVEKANAQFRIAQKIIASFEEDFLESKFFTSTIYESTMEYRKEIELLINE